MFTPPLRYELASAGSLAEKRAAVGTESIVAAPDLRVEVDELCRRDRPGLQCLEPVLDTDVVEWQAREAVAERLLLRAPLIRCARAEDVDLVVGERAAGAAGIGVGS